MKSGSRTDLMLKLAEAEVGYSINEDGAAKYWKEMFPGEHISPWCLAFVYWVITKGFGRLPSWFSSCVVVHDLWNGFRRRGMVTDNPKVGDIAFLQNGKWVNHCGIVSDVDDDSVTTIEGNVIKDGKSSVSKITRKLADESIAGYGRYIA